LTNKLGVGRKVIQQDLTKFSKRGIVERTPIAVPTFQAASGAIA
jgi:hypothetical protein